MNKYIKLMALVAVISNVQIAISADQAATTDSKSTDGAVSPRTAQIANLEQQVSVLTTRLEQLQKTSAPTEAGAMPTSPRPASPASNLDSGTPAAVAAPANTDTNSSTTSEPTTRSWLLMPTMPALRMPTAREAAIGAGVVVTAAAIAVGAAKKDDIRTFAKTRLGRN